MINRNKEKTLSLICKRNIYLSDKLRAHSIAILPYWSVKRASVTKEELGSIIAKRVGK